MKANIIQRQDQSSKGAPQLPLSLRHFVLGTSFLWHNAAFAYQSQLSGGEPKVIIMNVIMTES